MGADAGSIPRHTETEGSLDLRRSVLTASLLAVLLTFSMPQVARAEGGDVEVISSSVTSEFPTGMRFKLETTSQNEITSIALRFRIGQSARGIYQDLEFEAEQVVDSELFWRTNTSPRYIPPGTIITYNFEIEDAEGARLETEPQQFVYMDPRFDWIEISDGPVTVAYHGPVSTRAEVVLDAIVQTLGIMGSALGVETDTPIRVTMYNNVKEMLAALPPGSETHRRELITEGQAFPAFGTLLVLARGTRTMGTASHEVTHILTHRAARSSFGNLPAWLDEGLAEYGNIDPGYTYDVFLDAALALDRLLPITSRRAIPGDPEDVIIFYGEAKSLIRFMIDRFGTEKMTELMATLKSGRTVDDAIEKVYEVTKLELENLWRESIGAPLLRPSEGPRARPTAAPRAPLLPYSLTPQPQASTVGATDETPTPEPEAIPSEGPTETPALEPEPTATPTAVPTPTPKPEPVPVEGQAAAPAAPDSSPPATAAEPVAPTGSCAIPAGHAPVRTELSVIAVLVGLAGLGLRRRSKS